MAKQYIGGKTVVGEGRTVCVKDPATGEIIDSFAAANAKQAEEALIAAQDAFKTWSKTSLNERISWILRWRDACMAEREKIVEMISRESGRLYAFACADFDWCMTSFQFYADEMKRLYGTTFPNPATPKGGAYHIVERQPIGVTVAHLAWNYPLGNAGLKIAPAVVTGCTCVIKPSSQTPLATLYLGEIAERIGFPAGVVNIISGPSGEVAHTLNVSTIPKMITLIGSRETGLSIMRESATSVKKYSFELGGNAPVVVMPDVDIESVAQNIVGKKLGFAGQTCVNYNRIYVHKKIYDALADRIKDILKDYKPGAWKDQGCIMCPMIDTAARDRMLTLIDDALQNGAELVYGGKIPDGVGNGSYIEPTLLKNVSDEMKVSTEEIFGPIIPLQSFDSLDEAIEKSNNTIYGLSAYFFGHDARDISRAYEGFEAGEIFVNGSGGTEQVPHSGTKQSGVGCDKSYWSLEEYFDFKYLSMIP